MFMEALDAIKEYASVKGSPITKEDIEQYFKGLTLDEQQLNMVYQFVADVKVPDSDTIFEQEKEEVVTLSLQDYENLPREQIEKYQVRAWFSGHLYPEKPTGTRLDIEELERKGITDVFLNEPERYL